MDENSAAKLREMSREEVEIRLADLQEELRNLHFRAAMKQEGNPLQVRYVRRAIARAKTLLREDQEGVRPLAREQG